MLLFIFDPGLFQSTRSDSEAFFYSLCPSAWVSTCHKVISCGTARTHLSKYFSFDLSLNNSCGAAWTQNACTKCVLSVGDPPSPCG